MLRARAATRVEVLLVAILVKRHRERFMRKKHCRSRPAYDAQRGEVCGQAVGCSGVGPKASPIARIVMGEGLSMRGSAGLIAATPETGGAAIGRCAVIEKAARESRLALFTRREATIQARVGGVNYSLTRALVGRMHSDSRYVP